MPLKQADQKLMEDTIGLGHVEERLHLLEKAIAASSAGIVICDAGQPDRPIIYCNRTFERITGYSSQEVLGHNCRFLQGADTDPTAVEEIRASLREGRDCQVVLKNYRKDGTPFWNELNISPVRDTNGNLTHFIGVQNDISDRKRAQLERNQFFRLSLDMFCITGFDGYFQQLNPAWENTLGYTKEELLAKPLIEFVHPEDREVTLVELQKLSEGHSLVAFENRYICKDGSCKWLLWNSISILEQQICYAAARDITDRKQLEETRAKAEAALRESERKYRNLVETSQDIIWSMDIEGRFTFVNQAVRRIHGYEPEEMIGRQFIDFEPLEKRQIDWEMYERILAGESHFQYETVHLRKDGTPVDLSFNAMVLRDGDGNIVGATGTARDISDRKRAEEAMRSTETFLNTVLDNLPIGVNTKDAKTLRFVYWNKTTEKLFGYSRDEMQGKTDYDFFPKEQADFFTSKDREALETGKLIDIPEELVMTKHKTLKTLHTKKMLLLDEEGKPQYVLVITEDISERKQIEKALRESQAKFQKLAANLPGVIYQFVLRQDGSRSFPFMSSGCRDIYEVEPEAIQQNVELVLDTIPPNEREQFERSIIVSAQTLEPWHWEGQCIADSGKVRWIKCASRPERLANGDIIWDGLVMDISDRKQAEEALRRSEEQLRQKAGELEQTLRELQQTQSQLIQTEKMSSLGQLVAGVAHEINNPVTFIYGNLAHATEYIEDLLRLIQLYAKYYPNPAPEIQQQAEASDLDFLMEDLPKMLDSMKMGADRIREIVTSLRSFSRLDEAEMKPINIHEGIDSTLLILQHRLKEKPGHPRIQVIKQYDNLPLVECYPGQLNQVFMNILSNAIDALEEVISDGKANSKYQPNVKICTEVLDDNHVVIRIYDNGSGMTEEVKSRLFDPFFTTKDIGKGTGLGLAISYQIVVEKHRGTLHCVSQPEQGAEFSIEIPIHQVSKTEVSKIKN